MKKVLFTGMILTAFALGCAANYYPVAEPKEEGWKEKCKDCIFGANTASHISDAFDSLVIKEGIKYSFEEYKGEKTNAEFQSNTIYFDSASDWYYYITWKSSFYEEEELFIDEGWMAKFIDKSQLDDPRNLSADCLSKLSPVAKVLARAIVEELTVDEISAELDLALRTVEFSKKK